MQVVAVTGGDVVTRDGLRAADLLLDGATISRVGPREAPSAQGASGLVDATGCLVLAGGVDPHTHPLHDLGSATTAALHGGTTTIMAFTDERPGEGPVEAWRRAVDELRHARVDVLLHPLIRDPERLHRDALEELRRLGARSVKLFLAYPELGMMTSDRALFETLRSARELGLLVMVHCENGGVIAALEHAQLEAGVTGLAGFVASRPPAVEEEAVGRTLALARLAGAPVYLVHLSTRRSLDLVREARRQGQTGIFAEVCTHHLLFDDRCYDGPEAARYLTVPPMRARTDVEALWEGVVDGTVDTIGSDHAQLSYRPDVATADFRALPYSFAGVEPRLPLVLSEGIRRGVTPVRLAQLLAAGPAAAFGLGTAGSLHEGAAANVVVWDPEPAWVMTDGHLHGGHTTPFHGLEVQGRIRAVIRNGATAERDCVE